MWLTEVAGHTDRQVVFNLFALLTDGVLARTASNYIVQTAAAIALALQGLPLFLPRFPIAGTSSANVHCIKVSRQLEEVGESLVTS